MSLGWSSSPVGKKQKNIFLPHPILAASVKIRHLSGEFWLGQANQDVVKKFLFHFSSWAWSTPWGHVLSLITFRQIPVLSWAIRYSVFQKVKFTSSLQKWAGHVNLNYWHLVVNLVIMDDFKLISRTAFFRFGEINKSLFWIFWKIENFCLKYFSYN